MGPHEIASEYRTAANKALQIKILAELNAVPPLEIARILHEQGVSLPKRWAEALAAEEPLRLAPAPKTDPGEVLTVGLLRQYTEQLPPDTRILLPGDGSPTRLIFTQCFAADTGEKSSTLQLC
jgi:hypothetical protein